jgi:hypothetical protein
MATLTIVRTANASQLLSLLDQASASVTYAALAGAAFTGNISTTGRITSTNVPAVYAFSNSGSSITDDGVLPFNNAVFNNGNHYNASTSTFTAPVAGKYLVMCKILTNNDSGAADSRIAVNGSRLSAYAGYAVNSGVITTHKQGHIYGIVSLNANDTIQIRAQGTVSFYSNPSTGHSSLNIHLIG